MATIDKNKRSNSNDRSGSQQSSGKGGAKNTPSESTGKDGRSTPGSAQTKKDSAQPNRKQGGASNSARR